MTERTKMWAGAPGIRGQCSRMRKRNSSRWSLVLPAVLAALAAPASAQVAPPKAGDVAPIFKFHKRKADPQPLPDPIILQAASFFQTLKLGGPKVREAYETLLRGSRIGEVAENINILVTKTEGAIRAYGPALEFDHYDTQRVLGRLCAADFITWHATQPLQWRLVYYRPAEEWILIDVRVSDVVEDLFE